VSPDTLSVTLRALAFITLFQAVGAASFLALFCPELAASHPAVRRLAMAAAASACLLGLAHQCLEAARMAGDYSGLWDSDLQRLAWYSGSGRAQITQLTGLLGVMVSLGRRSARAPARAPALRASAGGALALAGFLLTGHTHAHPLHGALAPLLGVHLLIVAFWFGALWPLLLAIRLEAAPVAARLVARYSTLATFLVPLIPAAGLTMALLLTGGALLQYRPYEQLLLLKLLLFGLLMVPAACNKWLLGPKFSAHAARSNAASVGKAALQRSIGIEFLLISVVLTVTAALTTLYSPH
jgi:copper transport protein